MINVHNGNPADTITKIMNMTAFLHAYPAKPRSTEFRMPSTANCDYCEHISDWFVKCVTKYPRIMIDVLTNYIESIISNPVRGWNLESQQRALDYAAKYDAALFTKCNTSCQEYLHKALFSDEQSVRLRCVDLIGKILQLNSEVDWQMFRHEVSNVPREVYFIRDVIDSLQDCSDNIKQKSAQVLLLIMTRGSEKARTIFSQCIKNANYSDTGIDLPAEPRVRISEMLIERREQNSEQEVPTEYTFSGHDILEPSVRKLPQYIITFLYKNPLSFVRKNGILLMEELIKLNPQLIYKTKFITVS